MIEKTEQLRSYRDYLAAAISLVLTSTAWACVHLTPHTSRWQLPSLIGTIILLPGGLCAGLLSAVFSHRGFHGIDQLAVLIAPVSWLSYSLFFSYLMRRRRRVAHP
jgi:hypothetical protein